MIYGYIYIKVYSPQVRLQTQQPGDPQFKGTLDCAVQTVRNEARINGHFTALYILNTVLSLSPSTCLSDQLSCRVFVDCTEVCWPHSLG